jgi:uncharacterized protein YyaL (SSP411 family)
MNRLAHERSPYLLQHAGNPVDWFPWGEEAFAEARRREVPIFLSIGYSTCHWCHVMERESFESAGVAEVLNRDFVSIKVDREERPDVDRVYMTFVQVTTGAGGWPMSVWLTPQLKPFFGGTYFPPESRWGRPGFVEVLAEIARAWREDRDRLLASADQIVIRLREISGADGSAPDRAPAAGIEAVQAGVAQFAASFDSRRGGFGGAPKFPRPSEALFLLEAAALTGDPRPRQMALETLRAMAVGGMRDHIGGGFHRYSVDAEWRVPHFEKMLYDQAQLVLAYLEAAQASGDEFFAAVAEDTIAYVLRDLTGPEGGFYSAEDADSVRPGQSSGAPGDETGEHPEAAEGAFYVWTAAEIDALTGDDASVVRRRFGVEDDGNAPADPQGEFRGQNILHIAQSIEDVAARSSRTADDVMRALTGARQTLFTAREQRPRPHLDDKVITAWNGLMIAALARAARTMPDRPGRAEWLAAATRAADMIHTRLWRASDRRLLRRYRDGDASVDAFCEDYACLVWGLLELFETTGDVARLDWALELTAAQTELFFDPQDGGWFSTTGEDESVLLRLKEDYDGAEPAAASVTVRNHIALGHLTENEELRNRALRTLERYGPGLGQVARVMPLMLTNVILLLGRYTQVVLVGESGTADLGALESTLARTYLPWSVTIPLRSPAVRDALGARWPWLGAMQALDGRATAYVCYDFTCQAPVTSADDFERQLADAAAPRVLL